MSEGLKHICFDLDDTLYEQIATFFDRRCLLFNRYQMSR